METNYDLFYFGILINQNYIELFNNQSRILNIVDKKFIVIFNENFLSMVDLKDLLESGLNISNKLLMLKEFS
jgi:hypothetical protein